MTPFTRLAVLALVACAHAQYEERAPRYIASEPKQQAAPPVAILKQINSKSQSGKQMDDPRYLKEMREFMASIDMETRKRFNRITEERTRRLQGQMEGRWKSPKLKYKQRPKDGKLRHNEDGSYTYGYEAADGSFKIETKSPAGEVKGKYGYKDDTGKVRVIEYGANKYGFQPAGEGITVAPPTLVDETTREEGLRPGKSQASRNQYRPAAQAVDYDYEEPAPAPRPAPRPAPQYRAQPAPAQTPYRPPVPSPPAPYRAPAPTQQPQFRPAPQQQYRPAQGPAPPKPAFFAGAAPAPSQDNFFNPQPQQQRQYKSKQDFRPETQFQFAPNPKPQIEYSQDYSAPAPKRQQTYTRPYSMLDELLKEYELPSNGAAPLHDITFGSY